MPRYPKFNDFWGRCSTCGFDLPVSYLTLTRKHSWQCLPGSGLTRGCFDGNYDRDDIQYNYPAGEGTRQTAAPLTNTLTEGINEGETFTIQTLYDQSNHSTLWELLFTTPFIKFRPATLGLPAMGGVALNNGWVLYMKGTMKITRNLQLKDVVPLNSALSLFVQANGVMLYTPYVQTMLPA